MDDKPRVDNELYKKLKELEEKLKLANGEIKEPIIQKEEGHNDMKEDLMNEIHILRAEFVNMINDLKKKMGDLDRFLNNKIDELNVGAMKNAISNLENDIIKKANKFEVSECNDKIKNVDDYAKDLSYKVDNLEQNTDKLKIDLAQIIKKLEFLSGEYSKLAFNRIEKDDDKKNIADLNKFLTEEIFNEFKKYTNNRFERIRTALEDISKE